MLSRATIRACTAAVGVAVAMPVTGFPSLRATDDAVGQLGAGLPSASPRSPAQRSSCPISARLYHR